VLDHRQQIALDASAIGAELVSPSPLGPMQFLLHAKRSRLPRRSHHLPRPTRHPGTAFSQQRPGRPHPHL